MAVAAIILGLACVVLTLAWYKAETEIARLRDSLRHERKQTEDLHRLLKAKEHVVDEYNKQLSTVTKSRQEELEGWAATQKRVKELENELAHRRQIEGSRKL